VSPQLIVTPLQAVTRLAEFLTDGLQAVAAAAFPAATLSVEPIQTPLRDAYAPRHHPHGSDEAHAAATGAAACPKTYSLTDQTRVSDLIAASAHLARTSGSPFAFLALVQALLRTPQVRMQRHAVLAGAQLVFALRREAHLLRAATVQAEHDLPFLQSAQRTAPKKNEAGVLAGVKWDKQSSSPDLTFSSDGLTVTSSVGSHTHALLNCGPFTRGKASWEFLLKEDTSSQCTCFGAAIKPVTSSNYESSSSLFMYRAYNGNRYSRGVATALGTADNEKVKKGDRIRFELDFDEGDGIMRTFINDMDRGVAFKGLAGLELFPAIQFYSSGRSVTLVRVEGPLALSPGNMERQSPASNSAGESTASVFTAVSASSSDVAAAVGPENTVRGSAGFTIAAAPGMSAQAVPGAASHHSVQTAEQQINGFVLPMPPSLVDSHINGNINVHDYTAVDPNGLPISATCDSQIQVSDGLVSDPIRDQRLAAAGVASIHAHIDRMRDGTEGEEDVEDHGSGLLSPRAKAAAIGADAAVAAGMLSIDVGLMSSVYLCAVAEAACGVASSTVLGKFGKPGYLGASDKLPKDKDKVAVGGTPVKYAIAMMPPSTPKPTAPAMLAAEAGRDVLTNTVADEQQPQTPSLLSTPSSAAPDAVLSEPVENSVHHRSTPVSAAQGSKLANREGKRLFEGKAAFVSYWLGGRCRSLEGAVALADAADKSLRSPKAAGPVSFEIHGTRASDTMNANAVSLALNSRMLWSSRPFHLPASPSELFSVPLIGVDAIHLVVRCVGENAGAYSVWIDPILRGACEWECEGWRNDRTALVCGLCGLPRGAARPLPSAEELGVLIPTDTATDNAAPRQQVRNLSAPVPVSRAAALWMSTSHGLAHALLAHASLLCTEHLRSMRHKRPSGVKKDIVAKSLDPLENASSRPFVIDLSADTAKLSGSLFLFLCNSNTPHTLFTTDPALPVLSGPALGAACAAVVNMNTAALRLLALRGIKRSKHGSLLAPPELSNLGWAARIHASVLASLAQPNIDATGEITATLGLVCTSPQIRTLLQEAFLFHHALDMSLMRTQVRALPLSEVIFEITCEMPAIAYDQQNTRLPIESFVLFWQMEAEKKGMRTALLGKWPAAVSLLIDPTTADGLPNASEPGSAWAFVSSVMADLLPTLGLTHWYASQGIHRLPIVFEQGPIEDRARRRMIEASMGAIRIFPDVTTSFDALFNTVKASLREQPRAAEY
jgi:hypothetical protein